MTSRVSRTFVNNIHSKAIRNLAKSLQKHGKIELYYTHHQDLLLYSIREIAIPEGLRIKVIRFWLDKSNSDKEFNVFINECLNQGYGTLRIIKFLIVRFYSILFYFLKRDIKLKEFGEYFQIYVYQF